MHPKLVNPNVAQGSVAEGGKVLPSEYRAMASLVGIHDMLRVERWPNGQYNLSEHGTVQNSADLQWLRVNSPVQNVTDGDAYPAVLLITGVNDPRVERWPSRKFAAALQATTTALHSILSLTRMHERHAVAASCSQRVENSAAAPGLFAQPLGRGTTQRALLRTRVDGRNMPRHARRRSAVVPHHQEQSFMNRFNLLAASLLLVCCLPAHAAAVHEQTYVVGADVDATGRITATQVDADVPGTIADVLASAVKHWEFVPAKQDGHPVPAHTFIRAKLTAVPDQHGHDELRLEFVGNEPRLDKTNAAPRYPQDAARAGETAFLFLDVTVQPDGSLAAMTVRSQFANRPVRPAFEHAVLAAAKNWHATAEQVNGQPVATHMRIPANFTLSAQRLTQAQAESLRTAAGRREAIASAEANPPTNPLASDQPVALDSPLQPRSAIAAPAVH